MAYFLINDISFLHFSPVFIKFPIPQKKIFLKKVVNTPNVKKVHENYSFLMSFFNFPIINYNFCINNNNTNTSFKKKK